MSQIMRFLVVMGTRPEAIKLASIIKIAKTDLARFETTVVVTSQHRQMLDQMLETFAIVPEYDLDIMRHDQNLAQITSVAMEGLYEVVEKVSPDVVIVQGDTTTTLVGAMAAFYQQIPVAHVEAGLRTFDKKQPFPEEINRRLTTQIADYHFAPTEISRENLLKEGVSDERIWVTGNTCIDALHLALKPQRGTQARATKPRKLLVTAHRRENQGAPMERICTALVRLCERYPDLSVVFPMHLSPRVRSTVYPMLEKIQQVELTEPMEYVPFVKAMAEADIILSDSGGVQEEAPSLNKPVLVLRETTERPEGVTAGTLKLVGTKVDDIVAETSRLLDDMQHYDTMAKAENPFGNGTAGQQIVDQLWLQLSQEMQG